MWWQTFFTETTASQVQTRAPQKLTISEHGLTVKFEIPYLLCRYAVTHSANCQTTASVSCTHVMYYSKTWPLHTIITALAAHRQPNKCCSLVSDQEDSKEPSTHNSAGQHHQYLLKRRLLPKVVVLWSSWHNPSAPALKWVWHVRQGPTMLLLTNSGACRLTRRRCSAPWSCIWCLHRPAPVPPKEVTDVLPMVWQALLCLYTEMGLF